MKTMKTYNKDKIDQKTTYSNATPTPRAVGGIKEGSTFDNKEIVDIINDLLYPFVKPSVSISSVASGGIFENGTSVKFTALNYSVSKNSADSLNGLKAHLSGNISEDFAVVSGDFTSTPSGTKAVDYTITSDTSLSCSLSYSYGSQSVSDEHLSNLIQWTFVNPFFNGVSDSASANVKTLTKQVRRKGNQTLTFALNQQYIYYAYPKSYGTLKSIKDQSGFENINGFTLTTETLSLASGSVLYYVYRLTDKATASAMTLTFAF